MKNFRLEKIRKERGLCEACGDKAWRVYHIDGNQNNESEDNLVLLCRSCNQILRRGSMYRTSKYLRLYGMRLEEIAKLLKCSRPTVYGLHRKGELFRAIKSFR
jgi:hypothetical protein